MSAPIRNLVGRGMTLASGPIARGSIVSVVIKSAGIGLSFLQAVLAARLLGAEGYGVVAVALSVAQIASTFAVFGYGTLSVREIARWLSTGNTDLLGPFTRHAVTLVIALSLLGSAVIYMATIFAAQRLADYRLELLIGASIIPALALLQLFRGIIQGFGDVAGAQWPGEVLRPLLVISMIGALLAVSASFATTKFLILLSVASFACVAVGAVLVRTHLRKHRTVANGFAGNPGWFGKAAPFFSLSMLAVVQGELATLMLAVFASPEQAGLYQPIARLTPIIAVPATAAAMRYAPRVSEFWNAGEMERLISVTRTYTLTTAGLTSAATLILAELGPWLLLAFGRDFASMAPLLWIVGAGQVFSSACGPVGYLMTMTDNTGIAIRCQLIAVAASIIIGLILIPTYGALGAAIAIATGIVLWNLLLYFEVRRELGFDPSIMSTFIPK